MKLEEIEQLCNNISEENFVYNLPFSEADVKLRYNLYKLLPKLLEVAKAAKKMRDSNRYEKDKVTEFDVVFEELEKSCP